MTNHWSSGIRVDRGWSPPTALIINTKNLKSRKDTQKGHETPPKNVSGTMRKKSGLSKIPVSRKSVFSDKKITFSGITESRNF